MSGGGGGLDIGKELANFDKSLSLSENAPLIAAATAMYLSGGTVGGETLLGEAAATSAGAAEAAAAMEAAGSGIASLAPAAAAAAPAAAAAAPAAAAAAPAAAASALPAAGAAGVDAIGSGIATPYVGGQAAMVPSMAAPAAAPAATSGIAGMANSAATAYGNLPAVAKYGIPLAAAAMLADRKSPYPGQEPYDGPLSRLKYDPDRYHPLEVRPPTPYTPVYKDYRNMAGGGLADLGGYADYARGGRMLKGPGDGMSDSIPAVIAGKQPARLANDEFVVPADVVSHLGNGSSEAGAKQLYRMMDKVRTARTGKQAQAKQINPNKYMPA